MNIIHWLKDKVLEARIFVAFMMMVATNDAHFQRATANRMASLIRRRSQAQVARMERKNNTQKHLDK